MRIPWSRSLPPDVALGRPSGAAPGLAQGPAAYAPEDDAATLQALLLASLEQHAEQGAARCHGRRLSYRDLDKLSRALAAWLQQRGLQAGDRLVVMLPGGLPLPVVVLAALRAGLVLVPVDPTLPAEALVHALRDSGARGLVATAELMQQLQAPLERLALPVLLGVGAGDLLGPLAAALLRHRERHRERQRRGAVAVASAPVAAAPAPAAAVSVTGFIAALDRGRALDVRPAPQGPDDIAALLYTGGTTGVARGAVLLQRQLLANLRQAQDWLQPALQARPHDGPWVTVAALPLHHSFGFTLALLLTLARGGELLLVPDPRDTEALAALLQRERFHLFPSLNPVFEALARHPAADRIDWSGLRLSLSGGVAVEPATAMLWLLKTGSPIVQGYGLAECGPAVTCNRVDDTGFSGHVGYPLPGTELLLVDDEGRPVPPGRSGEIAVRGPQLMAGYWQRPEETARALLPSGHFLTGDIGRFDDSGALHLLDRKHDLVHVQGLPVVPGQVEEVVMRLAGVRECAVVGMPDAEAGERVRLVVVRSVAGSVLPSEAQLRAHCERHLAGYQRPALIEFRDSLPRSSVGKLLRRALR